MIRAALAFAMLAAPIAAQGQTIKRGEASAMPLPALAQRLLGRPAPEFREVGLFSRNWDYETGDLASIVFAEAPRFSGFSGICEVRTLSILFLPPKGASTDAPLIQQPPEEGRRFRIIDAAPGGKPPKSDIERQTRECAVGPVLPKGRWDRGGRYFFVSTASAAQLDLFVRTLRSAQDDARDHRHVPECWADVMLRDDPMCQDPVKALLSVSWLRAFGASYYEGDGLTHAIFFFKRDPRETPGADFVQVEIDAFVYATRDDARIMAVRIKGVTAVD